MSAGGKDLPTSFSGRVVRKLNEYSWRAMDMGARKDHEFNPGSKFRVLVSENDFFTEEAGFRIYSSGRRRFGHDHDKWVSCRGQRQHL